MDKKPKISCIMSVYNTEKYLDECIQSILNQTYTDFEFIISDDGSTDKSKEIIKKYAEKDKRIIFLDNKKNRGIVANLNDCLKRASGEYIAIMESDDISYPERFEIEFKELNKDEKLMLVGTNGNIIDETGKIISHFDDFGMDFDFHHSNCFYLIKGFTFSSPSVMFKKKAITVINGIFYSNLLWDFCFYSHIIFCGLKCKNINKYLINKRDYVNALHTRKAIEIEKEYLNRRFEFIKKYNLQKEDIFISMRIIRIFFKNIFLLYGVKFSQKLGIYKMLKPLWRKYVLHKQLLDE